MVWPQQVNKLFLSVQQWQAFRDIVYLDAQDCSLLPSTKIVGSPKKKLYVYNNDAQISKYSRNTVLKWSILCNDWSQWQLHIIYNFLADLHKLEVIFNLLTSIISVSKRLKKNLLLKWGVGLFNSPKIHLNADQF